MLALVGFATLMLGCPDRGADEDVVIDPRSGGYATWFDMFEPPEHAPGEPHAYDGCPAGSCEREQPAYLFSGEFHESAVDLRISGCTVGLDLVWARRYRSRAQLASYRTPLANNWDHSYNIFVEPPLTLAGGAPFSMTVYDGNARPAIFFDNGAGQYTADRYHRIGEFDVNNRFVLTFANGGQWIFKGNFEPAAYKLWKIVDRNGNVVELSYDASERLSRVTNAVGQYLELSYDASSHISSVMAYYDATMQRTVTYDHYGVGDPDGNQHDLKRVTLPPIVGTVTGNDFPLGTSTSYTYSTGLSQAERNGNLLTITDALGQAYLQNTYSAQTDPNKFDFDRLVTQVFGDPGDLIGLSYLPQTPTAANNWAVSKTWMNDRVGRVTANFFDADNQLVMIREYTGFANPDLITTETTNQPTGKLRASDPAYFETRYSYNADGHVTEVVHPRGNATQSVYEADLNPTASPLVRGNLRERHRVGLACSSTFPSISEYFEYEPSRGNEHGEQDFVTFFTDPVGNVTESTYDASGNRTAIIYAEPDTREDFSYTPIGQLEVHTMPEDQHGARREIRYSYASNGHLRDETVDPNGFALTTTTEFDPACNETRRVDPRGNDTFAIYNERDLIVREEGVLETCPAACGGGTPTRETTDRIYDANMNMVRVDYDNLRCDGSVNANAVLSVTYQLDILNENTEIREEVASGVEIVTGFQLDANREPMVVQYGEAVAGGDPFNTVTTRYDERGLVYRETRAQGSSLQSTNQTDYDLNGNDAVFKTGIEGPVRTTTHVYDCADRLIETVDPMGNVTNLLYDDASNVERRLFYGELVDVSSGGTSNVLLEDTRFYYDAMNRNDLTVKEQFDPATQLPVGGGSSSTTLVFDGESRVISEDHDGNITTTDYDTAGRTLETVDPIGNRVAMTYDAGGNVLTRTYDDYSTAFGTIQTGVWTMVYDARDNVVQIGEPMGQTTYQCYDFRGNLEQSVDGDGNRTYYAYDGAGRLVETSRELTDTGTGGGTVIGTAVTRRGWDDSNRLVSHEDPNGNVTSYTYDSLNRLTTETFADGSARTLTYDRHDNIITQIDPSGTRLTNRYDGLERLIRVSVSLGPGVGGGTTSETYRYDGRGLLVQAWDNDAIVTRAHDSLRGLWRETQTISPHPQLDVIYTRDNRGNAVTTEYPMTGRTITRTFDGNNRTRVLFDGVDTSFIYYLGPRVQRKLIPALPATSSYEYDLARRMTVSHHAETGAGGEIFDYRTYAWDARNNKVTEQEWVNGAFALRTSGHDSLSRMTSSDVNGTTATDRSVTYAFDDAGNRTSLAGDACAGAYTQAGTDALVNQYTETPCEKWGHDGGGNVRETSASGVDGRDRVLTYDHRGRLVSVVVDPKTVDEVALEFRYDVLGRKLSSERSDSAGKSSERYLYDGWNMIEEERSGGSASVVSYLYTGADRDDLDDRLQMLPDGGDPIWLFEDEAGATTAAVRLGGAGFDVERYAYYDYGAPVFLSGTPPAPSPTSIFDARFLFAGYRWLPDAGIYDVRTRHLDVQSGRFLSRDRLGIWADDGSLGNGYTYGANGPATYIDSMGEWHHPNLKNCTQDARPKIEGAMGVASPVLAKEMRDWFNRRKDRKKKKRKKEWNNREFSNHNPHPGREWWGKYNNTRFNRLVYNSRKIRKRLADNVITFRCKSTGNNCGKKKRGAWTLSSWHAWIRLCRNDRAGFFEPNGDRRHGPKVSGGLILHEVCHNINAIGDWKYDGETAYSEDRVLGLAADHPTKASWNAQNYNFFSREITP